MNFSVIFSPQIRKDKAEKKLLDSTRDSELVREKLQRKLDDAMGMLKRKEKEFDETLNHFQADIDNLESERGDLKNKLKDITKKTLIQGITQQAATAAAVKGLTSPSSSSSQPLASLQPMSLGPSVPMPVKDSPMLLQRLQEMQLALVTLKESSNRAQGEDMRQRMAKLKPLRLPNRRGFTHNIRGMLGYVHTYISNCHRLG